jgi:inosose dehydratase
MDDIIRALKDISYQGWITAELDSWPDPKEGAALSMNYVRKHLP